MESEAKYQEVADLVRDSEKILFITGAGISTDSGLPTYRGIGGLYDGNHTEEGFPIEEALSSRMMGERPEVTWKYLWEIAEVTRGAQPNCGHEIIAQWVKERPLSWILTQNVDGLHVSAYDHHVIEVHGRAEKLFCTGCGKNFNGDWYLFESGLVAKGEVPFCDDCESLLRPEVVLFGEFLSDAAIDQMGHLQNAGIELVLTIGTSSLFPYITAPVELASQFSIPCYEINPQRTTVSDLCNHRFDSGCTETLEQILNRI